MFSKISLFILSKSNTLTLNNPQDILTFATSKKECEEYMNNYLKATKLEHFTSWCGLKQLDPKSEESWLYYKELCCTDCCFFLYKIKIPKKEIASIYRQIYCTVPVGCSFETTSEILNFYHKFDKNLYEKLKLTIDNTNKQDGKQK